MKQHTYFFILLSFILLYSCKGKNAEISLKGNHSIYYWKLNAVANDLDTAVLRQYKFNHFYAKILDVDYSQKDKKPIPKAVLQSWQSIGYAWKNPHTPVVFITNNTFLKIDSVGVVQLANDVSKYINAYYQQLSGLLQAETLPWQAIQFDCDWTKTTKERYFNFLSAMKSLFPEKRITATLRLYPYKYAAAMGVPPVDELTLMCYNLGKIKDYHTPNSILDLQELKSYFNRKQNYPKPLTVALPTFGWLVWFSNKEYKGILYAQPSQLDSARFAQKGNLFIVKQDVEFAGSYLRTGDVLRSEWPSSKALTEALQYVLSREKSINGVSYFYYDTGLMQLFEPAIKENCKYFEP